MWIPASDSRAVIDALKELQLPKSGDSLRALSNGIKNNCITIWEQLISQTQISAQDAARAFMCIVHNF